MATPNHRRALPTLRGFASGDCGMAPRRTIKSKVRAGGADRHVRLGPVVRGQSRHTLIGWRELSG